MMDESEQLGMTMKTKEIHMSYKGFILKVVETMKSF